MVHECEENHADELGYDLLVDGYQDDEPMTVNEDANTIVLAEYLVDEKICTVEQRRSLLNLPTVANRGFAFVTQLECRVVDRDKLVKLHDALQAKAPAGVSGATYDRAAGTLSVNGVVIRLSPDTNQAEMCAILFKNAKSQSKRWSFDELLDVMDPHRDVADDPRKLYRAARELNTKVAAACKADNLFEYTTKDIRINPIYIVT